MVLSWVTERLGVAMREAEDIILRDFLLSAASQFNAKGGANGRLNGFIAVLKPNLIDMEAYGNSYGDMGEPDWDAKRLSGLAA